VGPSFHSDRFLSHGISLITADADNQRPPVATGFRINKSNPAA